MILYFEGGKEERGVDVTWIGIIGMVCCECGEGGSKHAVMAASVEVFCTRLLYCMVPLLHKKQDG